METDEVNDPDWLIDWSMSKMRPVELWSRQAMFKMKDDIEFDREWTVMPGAMNTEKRDVHLWSPIRVDEYDADGQYTGTTYLLEDFREAA